MNMLIVLCRTKGHTDLNGFCVEKVNTGTALWGEEKTFPIRGERRVVFGRNSTPDNSAAYNVGDENLFAGYGTFTRTGPAPDPTF
jgi:hypothetical protein